MINIITDFHELNAPISDGGCGDDWCTNNKYSAPSYYYLLNDNSNQLGDLLTGLKQHQFYFDSECDCHTAAAKYYQHHGLGYPYNSEWLQAVRRNHGGGGDVKSSHDANIIESQVMEFK